MRERASRHIRWIGVLAIVICIAWAMVSCGGEGVPPDSDKGTGIAPGSSGEPDEGLGDGAPLGGGGGEAGPIGEPQSLADWSEGGIAPWGPVIETHQVIVEPGEPPIPVNELASEDPFTPIYQLPDGTIVSTNQPLLDVVNGTLNPPPSIVPWQDGSDTFDIYDGQIILGFIPTQSQQDIELLIATHALTVIFSWFRPDIVSGGNEIAIFQFEYSPLLYPSFDDAFAHFALQPEIQFTEANTVNEYMPDYDDPGSSGYLLPNDWLYANRTSRYVEELGVDTSPHVPFGPEDENGQSFSTQAIAVLDQGVYRNHRDTAYV